MGVKGNEVDELSKAQSNIEHMKMRHKSGTLSELRSMTNPPTMVKTTLESVCLLLGEKVDSWRSIKAIISKNTFLLNIIQLKTEDIPEKTIRVMKKKYLSNPLYTVENVARVSTACAPLVKWCLAHVTYAEMIRVGNKGGIVEEERKRDSLGTDEESLEEDSFEMNEAAVEEEEVEGVEDVRAEIESNTRVEEVEEVNEVVESNERIEEAVETEEEKVEEVIEKEGVLEVREEVIEVKESNEPTEIIVEEKGEIVEEETNTGESIDDIKESNTILVEKEETPIIETSEDPIVKKVDTIAKEGESICNEEESLGREV
jgi:hypothetical protein